MMIQYFVRTIYNIDVISIIKRTIKIQSNQIKSSKEQLKLNNIKSNYCSTTNESQSYLNGGRAMTDWLLLQKKSRLSIQYLNEQISEGIDIIVLYYIILYYVI